jgi:hypothetical protein
LGFDHPAPHIELEKEMDKTELYKGFRIRAYEEWNGGWLAEARKPPTPINPETDYLATPSGHSTPEAAIDFIKQMIDSTSARQPHN